MQNGNNIILVEIITNTLIRVIVISGYALPNPFREMCFIKIPAIAQSIAKEDINRPPNMEREIPKIQTIIRAIIVKVGAENPSMLIEALFKNTPILAIVAAHIQPRYILKPYTLILSGIDMSGRIVVKRILIKNSVSKRPIIHKTDNPNLSLCQQKIQAILNKQLSMKSIPILLRISVIAELSTGDIAT